MGAGYSGWEFVGRIGQTNFRANLECSLDFQVSDFPYVQRFQYLAQNYALQIETRIRRCLGLP